MQNEVMNLDALANAARLLFGQAAAMQLAQTYHAFVDAMHQARQEGYANGYENGRIDGAEDIEDRLDTAFDEGFEQGSTFQQLEDAADSEQAIDESFDDGYLEGVDDARRMPNYADSRVQEILNDRADEAFEALEEMVQDEA